MPFGDAKYEVVAGQEPNCDIIDLDVETKRKILTPSCFWTSFKTTILIGIYFIPSISLTFYQRWLLKGIFCMTKQFWGKSFAIVIRTDEYRTDSTIVIFTVLDFHYPLSVVLVHLFVKFVLAVIIREIWGCLKHQPRKILPWRQFIKGMAPMGIASGMDVGLSNWGLEFVTVSLYAMTKSTTIIFILICSILFKLEKKSWSLATIVIMIAAGLLMFTYKSTQFNLLGFCLLLLASFASGLRWTCAQLLMQKTSGLSHPVDMIYHVQPWMIISLLPVAIASEGQSFITSCYLFRYNDVNVLYSTLTKMFIGAIIAFGMEFSEFLVVNHTSSLTLSIAGIFKEIIIVVLAVEWNGDMIAGINIIGLILCLCGISSHIIHKMQTTSLHVTEHRKEILSLQYNNSHDLKMPLINSEPETVSSEGEESDSQIIFNILNSRDR